MLDKVPNLPFFLEGIHLQGKKLILDTDLSVDLDIHDDQSHKWDDSMDHEAGEVDVVLDV